jgi:outer membrane protein OmpA-like peptidoglycan-associated protein
MCGAIQAAKAEDGCAVLVERFNDAVDAGAVGRAQSAVDAIATDATCGQLQIPVQRRLAVMRLRTALDLMARGRPISEFEATLIDSARLGVLWQSSATLGEVRFGERRFAEAARAFDEAIEIVKNEKLTPTPPEKIEIQTLIDRAAQARLLEANVGSEHNAPTYVKTVSDKRDGKLGGFFSPSVRGIVPHALPLPIIFDYNKASLTPVGEDATRDLIRAVQEQQPSKIVVVGHTDPRGGEEYNVKLSQERAASVAAFLKANGVDIPVEASGVGASEPLKIEDSAGLTTDDIYALNRRVEWLRN